MRRARIKHCLLHWAGYMKHFNELDRRTQEYAIAFFRALKSVPAEDVTFLGEKYLTDDKTCYTASYDDYMGRKPVKDAAMADRMEMPLECYKKRRIAIEKKLEPIMQEELNKIEIQQRDNLFEYVLKSGRLYLKNYNANEFGRVVGDVICTSDINKAMLFKRDSTEGQELAVGLGMTKTNPQDIAIQSLIYVMDVKPYIEKLTSYYLTKPYI